jgi:hypothetical protein
MFTINRIGKHPGAKIPGIGLSRPLDDATSARFP